MWRMCRLRGIPAHLKGYSGIFNQFVKMDSLINLQNSSTSALIPEEDQRLIWMDLEMTGLDVTVDHILEVACVITDQHLKAVNEGINLVVHQPDEILKQMNTWCQEHHGKSGLTAASCESIISPSIAEAKLLEYVQQYTRRGKCPLAGNTVHEDKKFISKYLPELADHFHYRIVDVSTVKELCRRWYPEDFKKAPQKKLTHRALDDIYESIAELRYYKKSIFKE